MTSRLPQRQCKSNKQNPAEGENARLGSKKRNVNLDMKRKKELSAVQDFTTIGSLVAFFYSALCGRINDRRRDAWRVLWEA